MERSDQLEQELGIDRFKELLKLTNNSVREMAKLLCTHEQTEEAKAKCMACYMRISRAIKRVEASDRKEKTLDTIEVFKKIPEIDRFKEVNKGKKTLNIQLRDLQKIWIKLEKKRPLLWNIDDAQKIIGEVREKGAAPYRLKQVFRAFFKAIKKREYLDEDVLRARRSDMRPDFTKRPRKREIMRFTPSQIIPILESCDTDRERIAIKLHITIRSREGDHGKGSLLGLKWKDIDWTDNFYGFPMVTITVFEPKAKGGTYWRHIPLDLWFKDLSKELEKLKTLDNDYIIPFDYHHYRMLWQKISDRIGQKFEPHDCRRSPSGWLRDLSLSDLAIGQYDARSGEAIGFTGCGWENAEMFYQRYGKMNPLAIYDKTKKLDIKIFDGLIKKIFDGCTQRNLCLC